MENITELLKTLDPSRIDEAVALLQSLRGRQPPPPPAAEPSFPSGSGTSDASHGSPEPEQQASGELTSVDQRRTPAAETFAELANAAAEDEDDLPLASIGHVLSLDEKKQARDTRKAGREAEREARRRMKEEEAALAKAELDARKAVADDEKERRRLLRDAERDARKAEREAEKEARRKAKEEEQEAEREARLKAREAEKEAQKAPKEAPNSLALFGFHSSAVKADGNRNRLFSTFVQDKRVAPAALQFWVRPEDRAPHKRDGVKGAEVDDEEASVMNVPAHGTSGGSATRHGAERGWGPAMEEESSLLHPPVCLDPAPSPPPPRPEVCVRDFNAMIEASSTVGVAPVRGLLRQCGCPFHAALPDPYPAFDNEVVFAGFFAIGYDPCQSRPPYFGTHNHLQEGHLNEEELLQMARFPLQGGMPRLSNLDYEYDSGDDWDVMEGDEDIAASSSGDSDAAADLDSLDSEDLEFINDDSDEDDSDCDIQRKIMEARQRRLHRLRNKDKLVPSYSGPFVGIAVDEHPLRGFDELVRYAPLHTAYFAALLQQELSTFSPAGAGASGSSGTGAAAGAAAAGVLEEELTAEEANARQQRALVEAALKNRRKMSDVEVNAMHTLIEANGRISNKMILGAFKDQDLCIGVAGAEIGRTIKRYYDRQHGLLVRRETPLSATDERLFVRVASAKRAARTDALGGGGGGGGAETGAAAAADGAEAEEDVDDSDEDDGGGAEDETAVDGNGGPVSAAAPASTTTAKTDSAPDKAAVAAAAAANAPARGSSPSPPVPLPPLAGEAVEEAGHPAPSPRHSGEARAEPTAVVLSRAKQMTLMDLLPPRAAAPPKRPREGEQAEDVDGGVTAFPAE